MLVFEIPLLAIEEKLSSLPLRESDASFLDALVCVFEGSFFLLEFIPVPFIGENSLGFFICKVLFLYNLISFCNPSALSSASSSEISSMFSIRVLVSYFQKS